MTIEVDLAVYKLLHKQRLTKTEEALAKGCLERYCEDTWPGYTASARTDTARRIAFDVECKAKEGKLSSDGSQKS